MLVVLVIVILEIIAGALAIAFNGVVVAFVSISPFPLKMVINNKLTVPDRKWYPDETN